MQQNFVEITHLKRSANNSWTFRITQDSIHTEFVEKFMHELARSGVFRGGWFVGNWWFDDECMALLSRFFSNWEEMKAKALAVESTAHPAPYLLTAEKRQ